MRPRYRGACMSGCNELNEAENAPQPPPIWGDFVKRFMYQYEKSYCKLSNHFPSHFPPFFNINDSMKRKQKKNLFLFLSIGLLPKQMANIIRMCLSVLVTVKAEKKVVYIYAVHIQNVIRKYFRRSHKLEFHRIFHRKIWIKLNISINILLVYIIHSRHHVENCYAKYTDTKQRSYFSFCINIV